MKKKKKKMNEKLDRIIKELNDIRIKETKKLLTFISVDLK